MTPQLNAPQNPPIGAQHANADINDLDDAYVGIGTGLARVFEDPETRPSRRSWDEWRRRGYYPYLKIGKRVFVKPADVRAALERRFKINATPPD